MRILLLIQFFFAVSGMSIKGNEFRYNY